SWRVLPWTHRRPQPATPYTFALHLLNTSFSRCHNMVTSPKKQPEAQNGNAGEKSLLNGVTTNGQTKQEKDQVGPTHEYYETIKKELKDLIARKKQLDRGLNAKEQEIFSRAYLEETSGGGNIIRGFDGYLKNTNRPKKGDINPEDRIFSFSSISFAKTMQRQEASIDSDELQDTRSATGGQKKKKRRRGDDDDFTSDSDTQPGVPTKRLRVSFGGANDD
ncbi:Chromatin modification-related protein EAF6, partial [Neolecta irregularis DAH-3]